MVNYLIGVDAGTFGTKSALIDLNGHVICTQHEECGIITPKPLWAEQWPDVWVDAVCKAIKALLAESIVDPSEIKGVAISSLYGGSGIPVDSNIRPLAPCLIWMDRRASAEVKWIMEHIDLDKLFRITGNFVDSYYGFTKMLWFKNNRPDVWNKIRYFLPPNAYVIYKLTGEIAVDYSSAGNIGGVFNINTRKWSDEMLRELSIPREFFPDRLVASSEIVGYITEHAAEVTGLKKGTPVIAGGVDAPVATLSAGAFTEGKNVAMVGTSMCWGFITEKTNLSPKLISGPHVIDPLNKVYTFGGAITAGAVVKWFRDVFGENENLAGNISKLNAYQLLEMKTKNIPAGSEGLIMLPYFMGERSPVWDSNARGTIVGLSLYHTKGHLYKAFMEGVAFALRHNMETVSGSELSLANEVILVGGATKSSVWPKIFADVTGRPVKIIIDEVDAPLGDALLAGLGTGLIKSPETLGDWLTFDETIYPNEKNTGVYDMLFEEYKDIYRNLKGNMANINKVYSTRKKF